MGLRHFIYSFLGLTLVMSPLQAKGPLGAVTLVNHVGREVHVSLIALAGSGPQITLPTGQAMTYRFKPKIMDPRGVIGFVVNDEAWEDDDVLMISRCSARFVEELRVGGNQAKMNRLTGGNMRITFKPEADGSISCDVEDNF